MPDRLARWFALAGLTLLLLGCAGGPMPREAVRPSPEDDVPRLLEMAQQAQARGEFEKSIRLYQRVLAGKPGDIQASLGVAQVLLAQHQPKPSLEWFERVLQQSNGLVIAREGKGYALLGLQRFKEAEAVFGQVVQEDSDRWKSWSGLGVLADLRNDGDAAQRYYAKALALLPEHPVLLNNRAFSLMLLHRYKEAEVLLRNALGHEPENQRILNNLAFCLAWQKRYDEALEALVRLFPEAQANNNVGYIAMLQQDYPSAERLFNRALVLSPVYYERAANNLAEVRRRIKADRQQPGVK